MLRHRFVLSIWVTGTVLLLGAWGHSIDRDSSIAWTSRSGRDLLRTDLYPGTLGVQIGESPWPSPPGIRFQSIGYGPQPVPGDKNALQHVDYFVGPFGEFDLFSSGRSWRLVLPVWFLLLLFTALCLPFYLRTRKKVSQSPRH